MAIWEEDTTTAIATAPGERHWDSAHKPSVISIAVQSSDRYPANRWSNCRSEG